MVYLINKNGDKTKGLINFNSNEALFFRKKFIETLYRDQINLLKKKYYFFMTWSWALRNEADIPHIDYHLAPIGGGSFINSKKIKLLIIQAEILLIKFLKKKITKGYMTSFQF